MFVVFKYETMQCESSKYDNATKYSNILKVTVEKTRSRVEKLSLRRVSRVLTLSWGAMWGLLRDFLRVCSRKGAGETASNRINRGWIYSCLDTLPHGFSTLLKLSKSWGLAHPDLYKSVTSHVPLRRCVELTNHPKTECELQRCLFSNKGRVFKKNGKLSTFCG